ncbi:MAG TPA: hypothetical protein VFH60_09305 [Chloroflexia bacterium]|nr:hypothetical protein [Chloroflexia bacterium]
MPQRFRSRGCLIAALLFAVVALLSCGGLFLLLRPPSAPDIVAELKQLPLYPSARNVVFGDSVTDNSFKDARRVRVVGAQGANSSPDIVRGYGEMSFEVQAEPSIVLDFYLREFSKRGWDCDPTGAQGPLVIQMGSCNITGQGPPWPRFTGFAGPGASPPWIALNPTHDLRHAVISAYKPRQGAPTTNVTISYDYVSLH